MLILTDLGFLNRLTTLAPRSVSNLWHFLKRGLAMGTVQPRGLEPPGQAQSLRLADLVV
jgi:hypothetical protein